ncbi:MAG: putative glycoside hydrolase [bacterium]|nr:putative glycoside hydrolase [bacterium]
MDIQSGDKIKQRTIIVLCLLLIIIGWSAPIRRAHAFTIPDHKYPRTAAFFLKTSPFSEDEIQSLAKFQLVILDAQVQLQQSTMLKRLRDMNPTIVLLAYTSGVEYPLHRLNDIEDARGIWHRIGDGLSPEWFLKTAEGSEVSFWPGNVLMNPGARNASGITYAEYFADFLTREVMRTGLWDGLFFDTVWDGIYWTNHTIDSDRDGVADDKEKVDRAWRDGQNLFFKALRDRIGDRYLLVGNGVLEPYAQYLNGRMFEGFPDPSEGGWAGSIARYRAISLLGAPPHITAINSDTKNTGNWKDWQRMRYGLTTTLLFDGYYSFDYGTQVRDLLYWYDEYSASLGKPSSFAARNILDGTTVGVVPGVWRRDFQYGVVLINSTNQEQSLKLDEEFERVHGKQDPETNDGSITSRVTLAPESGILLLRPIEAIIGSPFVNGAFARILNKAGEVARTGFFSYEQGQRGGTIVARRDLDHDGGDEIIVANNNAVVVRRANGDRIADFYPYGTNTSYGIRFALADMDGDGKDDIVTVPANGGNALVKLFHMDGRSFPKEWYAYGTSFSGGASIDVGDLDGDGVFEIVTGSGAGRKPEVRIFHADGSVVNKGWFAYATTFRGGVNVAVGDLDGDRRAEVITGAGRGGGPQVRIFDGKGKILNPGFFAFTSTKRDGVQVLAHDFDGDGKAEIVAMSTNVFTTAQLFRK